MLRIATWNLNRPTKNHPRHSREILEHVQRINADVWVLTETDSSICPGIDYRSVCSTQRDSLADITETWVTIWSRLPIASDGDLWNPLLSCCASVTTSAGELLVYGTVLPWLACTEYLPRRGKAAFLYSLENQRKDWQRLKKLHGLCIARDFNQDLGLKHYYGSNDGKQALLNLLEQDGLTCLTAGQYDKVARSTNNRSACVDHIVLSNDWLQYFHGAIEAWPSEQEIESGLTDHFGMLVDLAI
jgi:hypothetical protein